MIINILTSVEGRLYRGRVLNTNLSTEKDAKKSPKLKYLTRIYYQIKSLKCTLME